MKALKIILFGIVGLIVLYLILSLIGPKDYKVERSKVVNASPDIVWAEVVNYPQWASWSPFQEMEPTARNIFEGENGTVGSSMAWDGEKLGKGKMTISALDPNKKMDYELAFLEPMSMSSKGYFSFEGLENKQTKVTWVDEGNIPFLQRGMTLFMSMDKFMGPAFERGLFKLDSISAETAAILNEAEAEKAQMMAEEAAMDSVTAEYDVKK
jgi:hypothetical protein